MYLTDYHVHSYYSLDGVGSLQEHVRRAEKIGLREICFTDHLDFYPSEDGLSCYTLPSEDRLQSYLEEIAEVRQRGRVKVRAGLELDYKPEADRWVRELLDRFSLDFLLGSVHNVGPWPVSGPEETALAFFEAQGAEEGCLEYLALVEQTVATALFDSFAHLDLMKRFRPENGGLMARGKLRDRIVAILDLMASNNTGLEVNSSGLVHPPREVYPSLDLLRLARERGVKVVTVGSDSHRPDTVGRNLEAALSSARAAGYTEIYTFERRVARPIRLW